MVPAGILLPHRPRRRPRLRPSSRKSLRPRPLPLRSLTHRCRRPRPEERRHRKPRAYMRPRASRSWSGPGPIPRRIASGFSSGAAAAGPFGVGGQVCPGRDCRVAEEDPSAFGHLPDRWRVSSGRRAQSECRMPGLDQLRAPERNDRAPLRLLRFRRSGARHNPEEMPAVAGTALNWRCAAIPT
jgi:hypothetical protein